MLVKSHKNNLQSLQINPYFKIPYQKGKGEMKLHKKFKNMRKY